MTVHSRRSGLQTRAWPAVRRLAFLAAWAAVALAGTPSPAGAAAAQDTPGWEIVSPGDETGCAFETSFHFFLHEGPDPTRLLVWFQGGGACWDFTSCSGMFDRSVTDDELEEYGGIFDFDAPGNPFGGYSVVFVPYCTGDVHVGDATVAYGDASWQAPPVHHRGWSNVDATLAWMRENLEAPDRLVVAGASAGAYGALFHAPRLAELYPDASLALIGDSGLPLLNGYSEILERWGAGARLRSLWGQSGSGAPVTLEAAYEALARHRPHAPIAQLTSNHDHVQGAFYLVSGSPSWREEAFRLLHELEARYPSFRAFVVDGQAHGLLRDDAFFDREAAGVPLREWIGRLIAGQSVESRYCGACAIGD